MLKFFFSSFSLLLLLLLLSLHLIGAMFYLCHLHKPIYRLNAQENDTHTQEACSREVYRARLNIQRVRALHNNTKILFFTRFLFLSTVTKTILYAHSLLPRMLCSVFFFFFFIHLVFGYSIGTSHSPR